MKVRMVHGLCLWTLNYLTQWASLRSRSIHNLCQWSFPCTENCTVELSRNSSNQWSLVQTLSFKCFSRLVTKSGSSQVDEEMSSRVGLDIQLHQLVSAGDQCPAAAEVDDHASPSHFAYG